MTFTVTAIVFLAWEAAAITTGRIPTISTVMRRRPWWQSVALVTALAAVALDHLIGPVLP